MLKVIAGNAQHIGARQEQQDSFAFSNQGDAAFLSHGGFLGVVADGMGGLEGGHQASNGAVDAFLAGYRRKKPSDSIPTALYRSLEEANRAVLAVARRINAEGNTGTTLAAAVVHNDQLYWVSAGDSHIYLLRNGQLACINEDHTYAMSLWPSVAAGSMDREAARNDPQAQHLTSHLGMEQVALVDIAQRPFMLQPDDTIIVCSDGIYRSVSDTEIADAFRRFAPAKACEAIQAAVLAKGRSRQDNLTIIALRCQQVGAPAQPLPVTPLKPRKMLSPVLAAALAVEIAAVASLGALYAIRLNREPIVIPQPLQHGPATPSHTTKAGPPSAPSNATPNHSDHKPGAANPAAPQAQGTQQNSEDTDGGVVTPAPQPSTHSHGQRGQNGQHGQSAPTGQPPGAAGAHAMQGQGQPQSHPPQQGQQSAPPEDDDQ